MPDQIQAGTTDADLPTLSIHIATSPHELREGYKLIADSIAQQRQTLNRSLIFHPLTLSGTIALLAAVVRLNYANPATLLLFTAGVVIALLSVVQRLTADYLEEAERVGTGAEFKKRVGNAGAGEMIVALWGHVVIGAVVTAKPRLGQVEVWAWTVMRKYRSKGLGRDLLEAAVRRAGKGVRLQVAEDHANSFRIKSIPAMFNASLDAEEKRARAAVKAIVQ